MGPPHLRRTMSKAEREAAAKKEAEDARREKVQAEALEVGSHHKMSRERPRKPSSLHAL